MEERLFWGDAVGSGEDLIFDWLVDACSHYDRSVSLEEILEFTGNEVNEARLARLKSLLSTLHREGRVEKDVRGRRVYYWPVGL